MCSFPLSWTPAPSRNSPPVSRTFKAVSHRWQTDGHRSQHQIPGNCISWTACLPPFLPNSVVSSSSPLPLCVSPISSSRRSGRIRNLLQRTHLSCCSHHACSAVPLSAQPGYGYEADSACICEFYHAGLHQPMRYEISPATRALPRGTHTSGRMSRYEQADPPLHIFLICLHTFLAISRHPSSMRYDRMAHHGWMMS